MPGPNVPVYLCGARLLAHYPVSVITDGQGLNITLVGYLGRLHFGLVSCRELVPDIDVLADYLVDELADLVKAARTHAAAKNSSWPWPLPGLAMPELAMPGCRCQGADAGTGRARR